MNIIEELFYGNINPNDQTFERGSHYGKAMETVDTVETSLTESLEGREKQQFLDMVNAYSDILGVTTVESFIKGFRIGARFVLDTFVIEREGIFKDII